MNGQQIDRAFLAILRLSPQRRPSTAYSAPKGTNEHDTGPGIPFVVHVIARSRQQQHSQKPETVAWKRTASVWLLLEELESSGELFVEQLWRGGPMLTPPGGCLLDLLCGVGQDADTHPHRFARNRARTSSLE